MRRCYRKGVGLIGFAMMTLFLGSACRAEAVILDFEDVRQDNATINLVGPVYIREGFTLTALVDNNTPNFMSPGTLSTSFAGSAALYHGISVGEIVLTRTNAGLFDLLSIDLAELPGFDELGHPILAPFNVTFHGTRPNGSMVSTTVTHSDAFAFETFVFDGFSGLSHVNWFQGTGNIPSEFTHQFDNLVVDPTTPVPEPSTFFLLGFGLLGMSGWRRQRPSLLRGTGYRIASEMCILSQEFPQNFTDIDRFPSHGTAL